MDWLDESMKIASVYRQATLIIAAASSKDSSQGVSKIGRLQPPTYRVPYYKKEESLQAGYKIAECIEDTGIYTGTDGTLRKRPWAFQEWCLGRRKVFFTSQGIKWSRNTSE
ncbi:hypothetical protein LY76DRAFT_295634 [Colletotrichum caudatum]|nr:hypothetical protein LY76DRAFT_295634 [Colletotrichum caudatum]